MFTPMLNPPELFLSTPSARRATSVGAQQGTTVEFLSTPSARRATSCTQGAVSGFGFLSTPSARRATGSFRRDCRVFLKFLSTPSARRATSSPASWFSSSSISIHALREEGDFLLHS